MNARSQAHEHQAYSHAIDQLRLLLALARRARHAGNVAELGFLAVNDTHALHPYRQAALWLRIGGIKTLSGVIDPEANAPYTQWLHRLCSHLNEQHDQAATVDAIALPHDLATEWSQWLPPHALWLPLPHTGGLLLAAEQRWSDDVVLMLSEWMGIWHHAWRTRLHADMPLWQRVVQAFRGNQAPTTQPSGKRPKRHLWFIGLILATLFLPVQLTVLAPGELVPANAAVIRAPLDGVLGQFHVQPNEHVNQGQALFSFEQAPLAAREQVARQAWVTAQTEYRQHAQQAVSDTRAKMQLSTLLGQIEERRAEADYVKDQLARSTVSAPQEGIALFDDPSEWTGRPVQTGERIMRIAAPHDVEVEAWIPMDDAIPMQDQAEVKLYLATDPLTPIDAKLRYIAHEAVLRPDGHYAYRVRAQLKALTTMRIGLKGTAKLSGDAVPLIYWILRRPLATIRQSLGW